MDARWIVGVDGSESADAALRWAVGAARAQGEPPTVVAVHAWHVPLALTALMTKRGVDVDRLGLAATASHVVDEAIERLGDQGADVERLVTEGHAAPVLLDHAERAELLVLGRRGHSTLRHLVLGSVSSYCTINAPITTVVVPPEWEDRTISEIAVGFDGSDNSIAALRWAVDFAPAHAKLHAVSAVELAPWLDAETTIVRFPDEVRDATEGLTARFRAADPAGRAAHDIVLHSPKQALAEAAVTADLVVVGARGRGALGTAVLGSVTTWLLHHPIVPVAVVPDGRVG